MRLKLDENMGQRGSRLLREAGHDVATVREQGLAGARDPDLIAVCRREQRALVTLDMGFASPLAFRPADYAGIAVLRLPRQATPPQLDIAVRTLVGALNDRPIERRLWIVEMQRIREYQPEEDDGE